MIKADLIPKAPTVTLGVDKGTSYIKTSENIRFLSTAREIDSSELLLDEDSLLVEYEGKRYILGEAKGTYSDDLEKARHENSKLFILTAIALSSKHELINANVVTGLPIDYYNSQREIMRDLFKSQDMHKITIRGQQKYIKIDKFEIFPEGAGSFYSRADNRANTIIVDIGGLSVDCAYFDKNKKLDKHSTYQLGTMPLYRKIANKINVDHKMNKNIWDVEDILKDGLEKQTRIIPASELGLGKLIHSHVQGIVSSIKMEQYDLLGSKILIAGGGGLLLFNHLKDYEELSHAELLENTQFSNAIGYKNIGKAIFK